MGEVEPQFCRTTPKWVVELWFTWLWHQWFFVVGDGGGSDPPRAAPNPSSWGGGPTPPAPNLLYLSTKWSQICQKSRQNKQNIMRNQYKLWIFSLDWIIFTKFQHSKKICACSFDFEKRISRGNLVLVSSTTLVRNRVRSSWSNLST